MSSVSIFSAEDEEPDYCAIANCLDDKAYKKCPGKCAGNSGIQLILYT